MKIITANRTSSSAPLEHKDSGGEISGTPFSNMYGFIEYLVGRGAYDLSAYVTLMYYRRVSPVFDAVDRISDEVAGVRHTIYDHKADKYIDDHPLLDLLSKPNPKDSGWDFMKAISTYFLVTGNNYMIMTGGSKRPPLELWNCIPTRMTIVQDPGDGWAGEYVYNTVSGIQHYKRVEGGKQWRYLQDDVQEMVHTKTFNPGDGIDMMYGMSKLTPVYYEIEQWLQSSIHNLSLLKNGATVSGVLTTDQNLTDDQYQRLLKEMQLYFMGARNAGRPMVTEGGLKYQPMGQTNREMDFEKLKTHIMDMLYNVLRIPLPMVSRAQMTMNNMDGAKFIFYDNAVLPIYNRIMDSLGEALFPRYKMDPQQYQITFLQDDIPSLEARKMQSTKDLKDLDVLTDNEIRARIGYGKITDGDLVYRPNTMVAGGEDEDTSDEAATDKDTDALNREAPPADDEGGGDESETGKKSVSKFFDLMRAKKNPDGKRTYSDDQILFFARQYGLVKALDKVSFPI